MADVDPILFKQITELKIDLGIIHEMKKLGSNAVEIFVGLLAVVDAPLEAVAAFAGSRLVEGLGTEAVAFSVASVTAVVVIVGFVVVVADSAECVVLWAD